jgi:hypothetical protein
MNKSSLSITDAMLSKCGMKDEDSSFLYLAAS